MRHKLSNIVFLVLMMSMSFSTFAQSGKWVMIDDNFNKSIGFNKVRILNKPTTNWDYCCIFFASSPNYNSNGCETVYNINFWKMIIGDNCNQSASDKIVSVVGKNVGDNWYEYTFKNTIYFCYYQNNCPRNQVMAFIPTQSYTYDDYSPQQSFAQSGEEYFNLGSAYFDKGDYDQAINYWNKAISAGDINCGVAYYNLGNAYYYIGDYDQAIIYYNKAISAGYINDDVYDALDDAYDDKGDYDQAIIYDNKAISAGNIVVSGNGNSINYNYNSHNTIVNQSQNYNKAISAGNTLNQKYPDYANEDESDFAYAMIHKDYSIYDDVDIVSTSTYQNNNNTFAVIIANEDYKEEAKVPNAKSDGEVFKNYCQNVFGIPDKNIKYVENGTLNTIKHELKWLKDVAEAYKGDASVIFYYAGHGIPDESSKEAYLLPVDGYGSDPTTGYSLTDLYSLLGSLPTKKCVAFLDACFSGSKRDGRMMASSRGVSIKVKSNKPKGNLVVLSAAQGYETAYAYKDKGHGMFTYFILKKLKDSNGDVTLGDLSQYVIDQVSKKSIVENGKSQTPAVLISDNATNWQSWKLK